MNGIFTSVRFQPQMHDIRHSQIQGILLNIWPVMFKSIKAIKVNEKIPETLCKTERN